MEQPYKIGTNYLIITSSDFYIGKLEAIFENEFVISNCSWIINAGNFRDLIDKGIIPDKERFNSPIILNREIIKYSTEWPFEL